MTSTLRNTQTISQIAELLYRFLPGNPHPYAAADISFPGVANKLGLGKFWIIGSKKQAITQLLLRTYEDRREIFCDLFVEIIKMGTIYLSNKREPITRDEIVKLNHLLIKLKFKIPELWDPNYLDSLPLSQPAKKIDLDLDNREEIEKLKKELVAMTNLEAHVRGFAFEKFLNKMFDIYNLKPHAPFRIVGEQIDGSLQIGTDTYLVEAKWHNKQIDQSELLIFNSKVEGKSKWSRGLLVSYNGFTAEGLIAFSKGRPTNIIGINNQDLFHILNGEMSLVEAINLKARRAAETGEFFVSAFDLKRNG